MYNQLYGCQLTKYSSEFYDATEIENQQLHYEKKIGQAERDVIGRMFDFLFFQ